MTDRLTEDQLSAHLDIQEPAVPPAGRTLRELLQTPSWTEEQQAAVRSLAKEIDIHGKLRLERPDRDDAEPVAADPAPEMWRLAYGVLHKALRTDEAENATPARRLKWLNVLYKTADRLDLGADTSKTVLADLDQRLTDQAKVWSPVSGDNADDAPSTGHDGQTADGSTTIPLTVLFYDSPIARAYLATLRGLGLRPERIINLVAAKDLVTKKPVGRWLPRSIRRDYAAHRHRTRIHYWPQRLQRTAKGTVTTLLHGISRQFGFPAQVLDDAHSMTPLSGYSDTIDTVLISGLKDDALAAYLRNLPAATVLYTGGGIVPRDLLDLTHLRFLHVHPGYLPDIRGADCTLWSALLHRRLSASCFYMAPGIDTGDIVARRWLPPFAAPLAPELEAPNRYRAIYGFLDPWVRAYVLRSVVTQNREFGQMASRPQRPEEGQTFHFMHPKIQAAAIAALEGAPAPGA